MHELHPAIDTAVLLSAGLAAGPCTKLLCMAPLHAARAAGSQAKRAKRTRSFSETPAPSLAITSVCRGQLSETTCNATHVSLANSCKRHTDVQGIGCMSPPCGWEMAPPLQCRWEVAGMIWTSCIWIYMAGSHLCCASTWCITFAASGRRNVLVHRCSGTGLCSAHAVLQLVASLASVCIPLDAQARRRVHVKRWDPQHLIELGRRGAWPSLLTTYRQSTVGQRARDLDHPTGEDLHEG